MPAPSRLATGTMVVGIFETINVRHLEMFAEHTGEGGVVVLVLTDEIATACRGMPCVSGASARAEVVAHMRGVDDVRVVGVAQLEQEMNAARPGTLIISAEESVRDLVSTVYARSHPSQESGVADPRAPGTR